MGRMRASANEQSGRWSCARQHQRGRGTPPRARFVCFLQINDNTYSFMALEAKKSSQPERCCALGRSRSLSFARCSAHRAEYPPGFANSRVRAPPYVHKCTHVAWGLVLVLCEGSTKSFIKKSLKQKSYGAWKIKKVILHIEYLVRTALSSAVRAHPEVEVEVRSARSVRARTGTKRPATCE